MKSKTIDLFTKKSLFIIHGYTNEDVYQWTVGAFFNLGDAEKFLQSLNSFLIDNKIPTSSLLPCNLDYTPNNVNDPSLERCWSDYGVEYSIEEVFVLGH